MAPVVCLCAVTQLELAAPPRCEHQAQVLGGWQSARRGSRPPANAPSLSHLLALTPWGACTGRTWASVLGSPLVLRSFPSWTWNDHRPDGHPGLYPRKVAGSVTRRPGTPRPRRLPGSQAGPGSGWQRWPGDRGPPREAGGRVLPGISPTPAPPRPPSRGHPTRPALPGPGSRCWMWSHEATGKASSQCRKARGKRACGGGGGTASDVGTP